MTNKMMANNENAVTVYDANNTMSLETVVNFAAPVAAGFSAVALVEWICDNPSLLTKVAETIGLKKKKKTNWVVVGAATIGVALLGNIIGKYVSDGMAEAVGNTLSRIPIEDEEHTIETLSESIKANKNEIAEALSKFMQTPAGYSDPNMVNVTTDSKIATLESKIDMLVDSNTKLTQNLNKFTEIMAAATLPAATAETTEEKKDAAEEEKKESDTSKKDEKKKEKKELKLEFSEEQAKYFDLKQLDAVEELAKNKGKYIRTANRIGRIITKLIESKTLGEEALTLDPAEHFSAGHFILRGKNSIGKALAIHCTPMNHYDGGNCYIYDESDFTNLPMEVEKVKALLAKNMKA